MRNLEVPPPQQTNSGDAINILGIVKGEERYVFIFDDDHRTETLRTFGRFASDPELSFSWFDACVLSKRMREQARQAEAAMETTVVEPDHVPPEGDPWREWEDGINGNGGSDA